MKVFVTSTEEESAPEQKFSPGLCLFHISAHLFLIATSCGCEHICWWEVWACVCICLCVSVIAVGVDWCVSDLLLSLDVCAWLWMLTSVCVLHEIGWWPLCVCVCLHGSLPCNPLIQTVAVLSGDCMDAAKRKQPTLDELASHTWWVPGLRESSLGLFTLSCLVCTRVCRQFCPQMRDCGNCVGVCVDRVRKSAWVLARKC